MSPWDIIGWTLIAIVALLFVLVAWRFVYLLALHLVSMPKARRPEVGQTWVSANGEQNLYVTSVDHDRVCIQSYNPRWARPPGFTWETGCTRAQFIARVQGQAMRYIGSWQAE